MCGPHSKSASKPKAPVYSSNPMLTHTAPIKLSRVQNRKTWHGKRPLRELSEVRDLGMRAIRLYYVHIRNCQRKIELIKINTNLKAGQVAHLVSCTWCKHLNLSYENTHNGQKGQLLPMTQRGKGEGSQASQSSRTQGALSSVKISERPCLRTVRCRTMGEDTWSWPLTSTWTVECSNTCTQWHTHIHTRAHAHSDTHTMGRTLAPHTHSPSSNLSCWKENFGFYLLKPEALFFLHIAPKSKILLFFPKNDSRQPWSLKW